MAGKYVIFGTAGHIDHGKTAFVKAVTGVDTDRLQEEKDRGITIDLGFAHRELEDGTVASFIDVPGHEGFVKNMLAGISGIDAVILVIAADESVKPQSREHFNICKLLGVENGFTVLTKADLVDEEILDLVEMEVEDLVKGSFLENSPVIRVDSLSGRGIKEAVRRLEETAVEIGREKEEGAYLLHIDRAFTMKGFGTVITGTSVRGKVAKGDTLELLPGGLRTRVRGIQVHGRDVEKAGGGCRTALNLQDIDVERIDRGMAAAVPDVYRSSSLLDVMLEVLPGSPVAVRNMDPIRFHHGSVEAVGRVQPFRNNPVRAGQKTPARIKLEKSVIAVPGEKFIVRRYSPPMTVGGGTILDNFPRGKPPRPEELTKLEGAGGGTRLEYYTARAGREGLDEKEITARWGAAFDKIDALCDNGGVEILADNPRTVFHIDAVEEIENDILDFLTDYHRKYPLKSGVSLKELKNGVYAYGRDRVFEEILKELEISGKIKSEKELYALSSFEIEMSDRDRTIKSRLEDVYSKAGLNPPAPGPILDEMGGRGEAVFSLLLRLGTLIKIDEELVFHKGALEELKNRVRGIGREKEVITIADFKNLTGTSRKYSIPLLEYLDREKVTRRVEGGRRLRE